VSVITRPVGQAAWVLACVLTTGLAACAPTTPPPGANDTPPPSGVSSASPVSGAPVVTTNGSAVQIVGTGQATTPTFQLGNGTTHVTISTCGSNGVIPFVTLYDSTGGMAGFIVDAAYDVKNLKAGKFSLGVVANPDCTWTITLAPA
jgi:hypothetical protein